jgi:dTDP-4-dehydrorhamnose reductase
MVVKALKNAGHEVRGVGREGFSIVPTNESVIGIKLWRATDEDTEYVVNCIGAIKPMFKDDMLGSIYTNAIFPLQLANAAQKAKKKLIHITTDCVFDGVTGKYDETSKHNATDEYGKSKSLGEPANCLVLRTSIIGPEIGGRKRSLLEWVRSQEGKTVKGFQNHLWNGVTTLELGNVIDRIIVQNLYQNGTFHVFGEDVTKAQLLCNIAYAYKIPLTVNTINAPEACDRTLRTVKELQEKVQPAGLDTMLKELVACQGNSTSQ